MGKLPKRQLPSAVKSKVNVLALKKNILKVKDKMARSEMKRAKKLISDLKDGAEAYHILDLPPISTPNTRSAFDHGAVLTDTVCTWVKKGFVAGPFDTPPVPGFRGNQLAVVPRNGKIRPILNLSSPKGGSFNDNVDKGALERLHMGTAKQFSFLLRDAGHGARFSKYDIQDAYKLIPAKVSDYRLQGFTVSGWGSILWS